MNGLVIWQFYILGKMYYNRFLAYAIQNLEFASRSDIFFYTNLNPIVSKYFQRVSFLD